MNLIPVKQLRHVSASDYSNIDWANLSSTKVISADAIGTKVVELQSNIDSEAATRLAADNAATQDRADIRQEFAAADTALQANLDAEISATNADVAAATQDRADIRSEFAAADTALQTALDAEISATNADVAAATQDRADIRSEFAAADSDLQDDINTEKARIDAILLASTADTDTFAEVVSLVTSVDVENDSIMAGYVLSNNSVVAALQADVDQNEADADAAILALQADVDKNESDADAAILAVQQDVDANELAATQDRADIRSEFADADSDLQDALDAEISATNADVAAASEDRALIREEFALADEELQTALDAEISATNADVAAAAQDRADIRNEFAVADAAIQAEVDQLSADIIKEGDFEMVSTDGPTVAGSAVEEVVDGEIIHKSVEVFCNGLMMKGGYSITYDGSETTISFQPSAKFDLDQYDNIVFKYVKISA